MLHETFGVFRECPRKFYFAVKDFLLDFHGIICTERIYANNHFLNENSKGPPISRFSVARIEDNFWSNVLRGTAQCLRFVGAHLGKTEVSQLQVSVVRDE